MDHILWAIWDWQLTQLLLLETSYCCFFLSKKNNNIYCFKFYNIFHPRDFWFGMRGIYLMNGMVISLLG